MLPHIKRLLMGSRLNPYRLAGNAAVYSLDGAPSDMTYIVDGSGRLQLVADRSGNSGVNCLVLNGSVGNYASTPHADAVNITGDIQIEALISPNAWNVDGTFAAKRTGGGVASSFDFYTSATNKFGFYDGRTEYLSTVEFPFSAFDEIWVMVTRNATSGVVKYFTKTTDGTWTQLGGDVAGTAGLLNETLASVEIGAFSNGTARPFSGKVKRLLIRNGIDGPIVFDADFTRVAKLAGNFVCSTGQTVTINTSGDTGARICGARDLVQLTQAKQPIVSVAADGVNIATFDGADDYMKAAPFPLSQPESVYWVGSQESWTEGDCLFSGDLNGTPLVIQHTSSPRLSIYADAYGPETSYFAIGARGVIRAIFNGAASSIAANKEAATIGSVPATASTGFCIGANGGGETGFAHVTLCESVVAARSDSDALGLRIADALMRKWRAQP